ncbi:ABC transporter permease [Salarchaeum sp. JOR-1]|uniref:ABC transporter permease n=1 Tax=Salarchaeum sp. JOR-1 TaxID=2599399 RepID=UPI001198C9A3|nr:ABC transporter permease [Salarchaeum sp. JOR-1]QDX41517.1 ABC transporter permease [Salarchaeum sp. JOR-1]
MAAENDPDTFEDVDWDSIGRTGLATVSNKTFAFLAAMLVLAAGVAYDLFVVPIGEPTFESVNLVLFELTWEVSNVDWLFIATMVVLFFYALLPLYQQPRMTRIYWDQFKRNRAAVASGVFLIAIFLIGTVGTMVLPEPTVNILAGLQPPVYTTVPMEVLGGSGCVGEVTQTASGTRLCHGTWAHPLGTMANGKDIFLMVVYGMKVTMEVGLIASLLIVVIGTLVGSVAAYSGGLVDEILMRYVDIQITFPTFFLYLLLIYLFGGSLFLMILLFGLVTWGGVARLVRSEALQRNEEEYIMAADGAGASTPYIIRRHIIPNVSNTVITAATLTIPTIILAEAALSFLGLGDPTVPSWGQVISAGRGSLSDAPWISTIPGLFLFFTILAFNFIGDALRDALDPRSD